MNIFDKKAQANDFYSVRIFVQFYAASPYNMHWKYLPIAYYNIRVNHFIRSIP